MSQVRAAASTMMRAVRVAEFGSPRVMKVERVPIPPVQPGQVLIKVAAADLNPVDTYIRAGAYGTLPTPPYTPGMDNAGVVERVGSGVDSFKTGDRVFTSRTLSGSYAEYCLADTATTFRLHDNLSFVEGACIGTTYFTAYRALVLRGKVRSGESVLIHGASGGVGLAACQLARSLDLTVLGTAGTPEGMDLVKKNGASNVFNHRDQGYLNQIKDATGGAGVDIIVEMLSNVNLSNDLTLLKRHGRVMVVGCRGPIEINPRQMMGPELSIMGVSLLGSTPADWLEAGEAIVEGMKKGWVKPVIDKTYTLEEAPQAHVDIIDSRGARGNLVFKL